MSRKKPSIALVSVPVLVVADAVAALDASEELLELLKGVLNGECDDSYNELLGVFQDHVIVSARIRLHASLKGSPTPKGKK
jgi:hypothetical protein